MNDIRTIERRTVELSHGKTVVWEAGSGDPVVLLHGVRFWEGGDYWISTIQALSAQFHVYAPDLMGWGDGERLFVEYSFAYLVDFVRELQDALGLTSAHIVGHSMGGWVAALLAYESPERVRTLTLVANGGMSTSTPHMMKQVQVPTREELVQYARGIGQMRESEINEAVERWLARVERPDAVAAYTLIMRHMTHPIHRARYNLRRRLRYIKAPTLIVWGEFDLVNSVEFGKEMYQALPAAHMVVLPCGHDCVKEQPDAFHQALIPFLREYAKGDGP
ncbi:hydrolase [Alicyclobacillus hesperidum subsp. aegles]|uniref:alpha/beta fold hydrolase n=1 Tax=Alicyclobacillus hesperidum TaxID=89784 RepID=UPI0007192458|nr:alpha/beta hydrolase [Alicyclobacillus hesperidum]GLG00109.1 hydrolase [Alicyclobacillus hesperidum subsp. aegles]